MNGIAMVRLVLHGLGQPGMGLLLIGVLGLVLATFVGSAMWLVRTVAGNAECVVIRNGDSPTPSLGGPCGMRRVTAIGSAPSGCELAGKDGVGQEDRLPRARSKGDDVVTCRVAQGRNATDAGDQLNLPLDISVLRSPASRSSEDHLTIDSGQRRLTKIIRCIPVFARVISGSPIARFPVRRRH
jgi:hypothetical protein